MIPQNWNKIDENEYMEYNKNNPIMHCTDAFTKESFDKTITILFYEMGNFQEDAFEKIKEYIKNINEYNRLIDGNPYNPDFEDTSIISYLYYKEFQMTNNKAFINIAKVLVAENNYNIVCQINYEKDGKLCNVQYVMPQFDIYDINGSLQKDGTLAEIIQYLEI